VLVPERAAERQLALRQGIPATESTLAADSAFLSSNGRFIAFVSMVELLPTDTRRGADVYVMDRGSSMLTLETPAISRGESRGASRHPRLSGDGRYLVFESAADDLVSSPSSHRATHIFVRDRVRRLTTRLSSPDANHTSDAPAMSEDGRVVAFESWATNLVTGLDANGVGRDVYLVRLETGLVIRASVRSDGRQPSDGESHSPSVSGDGRYLAFVSTADLDGAPVGRGDGPSRRSAIYVRDLLTENTSCVSCFGAFSGGEASQPHLSADGRFVAFTWQPDRGRPPAVTRTDIVLHDRHGATTTMITKHANARSTRPQMSPDGGYVAFESLASNLACSQWRCPPGTSDENLLRDIYLFDRSSGQFARVSGGPNEWWVPSIGVSVAREGTVISFSSRQPIDAHDPTTDFDLFVRTLAAPRGSEHQPLHPIYGPSPLISGTDMADHFATPMRCMDGLKEAAAEVSSAGEWCAR
jgi:Tol biopolymer transport system component